MPRECDTTLDGDTAVSRVIWSVAGRVQDHRIPGTLTMTLGWRRDGTGWRCTTFGAQDTTPMLDLLGGNKQRITPAVLKAMAGLLGG